MKKVFRTISGIIPGLVLFFILISCGGASRSSGDGTKGTSDSGLSDERAIPVVTDFTTGLSIDSATIRVCIFTATEPVYVSFDGLEAEIDRLNIPFVPWVNQIRAGDYIHTENTLFFPVNGLGFGRILNEESGPVIIYPEENEFFIGRTLGRTSLSDKGILCQFYGDRVYSADPVTGGPALAEYSPIDDKFDEIHLPAGRGGSEELVEIFFGEDEWLLSWKSFGKDGVSFRRQIFTPSIGDIRAIGADEYRQKLFPIPLEKAPKNVSSIIDRYLVEEPKGKRVYLLNWTDTGGKVAVPWYYGDADYLKSGNGELYILNGHTAGDDTYLLDGKRGAVWSLSAETPLLLPDLPGNCVYTDFYVLDSFMVLSWEEQVFPDVGAAGIVIAELHT